MTSRNCRCGRWIGAGLAAAALFAGCTGLESQVGTTSLRDVSAEPRGAALGQPLTVDWLSACDTIARDLAMAAAFQTAEEPKVVEIKPIENVTGVPLDCKIYPETIRAKIVESGNPRIVFRDESAVKQVVEERVNQSGEPLVVEQSSETRKTERKPVGPASDGRVMSESSSVEAVSVKRTAEVSSKVARADYFLNGKVYAQNETAAGAQGSGLRYYQFQFRLTDARTGLIKWEKMYRVKREGALERVGP